MIREAVNTHGHGLSPVLDIHTRYVSLILAINARDIFSKTVISHQCSLKYESYWNEKHYLKNDMRTHELESQSTLSFVHTVKVASISPVMSSYP